MKTSFWLLSAALLLLTTFSSCYKYENYYNEIQVITDGSSRKLVLGHEGADDLATYGFGGFYPSIVYTSGSKGDTLNAEIDWSDSYYEWLNPRSEDLYFFHFFNGQFVTETERVSDGFRLKPGIKYIFDLNTGEVINTRERSEKINTGGGISLSGCNGLVKTWTLQSVNGNALPYKEYDDGSNSLSWTRGTMTFTSSDTWSSSITSKQVRSGSSEDVVTDRSGSYSCSGGSGTHTNASGSGGSFSLSGGTLTVTSGSYTLSYK